ncbi:MAG: hypothetical protein Q7V31_05980 [Parvibaculum sp.]|uniref:hypothetical protein n=1 Tax=Parvibaculum sp. TaxID=2024848 RepID=UPI002720A0AF|nr:hypothetical protein [Parvibaculum sp.]MDO8838459.1 hypothetical protein [Parvibaculum sp.]
MLRVLSARILGRRDLPRFPNNRFLTPPPLEPLNLDLASLGGGGWAPAEFEGETHDGRKVYCRYRGGWLQVFVADAPGKEAYDEDFRVFLENVGPDFHGGLSLGQLCRRAGITINGECPPLPDRAEMRREHFCDLNGATTFYGGGNRCTRETVCRVVAEICRLAPLSSIVQPVIDDRHRMAGGVLLDTPDDITYFRSFVVVGERPPKSELATLSNECWLEDICPDVLVYTVTADGFPHMRPYGKDFEMAEKHLGRALRVVGQDEDCLTTSLNVSTSFPTEDAARWQKAIEIDKAIYECFLDYELHYYDLQTGKREPLKEGWFSTGHFDPVIVRWVDAADDRWLRIFGEGTGEERRYVGVRAVPASQPLA